MKPTTPLFAPLLAACLLVTPACDQATVDALLADAVPAKVQASAPASSQTGPGAAKPAAAVPLTGKEVWTQDSEVFGSGNLRHSIRQTGDDFAWYVVSEAAIACTLAPTLTTTNMDVAPFEPLQVVPAGGTVKLATFAISDPEQAYKYGVKYKFRFGDATASPSPYVYALPWSAAEPRKVVQGFHGTFSHTGDSEYAVDISMPEGQAIRAAREGTVAALNAAATTGGTDPAFKEIERVNFVYVAHDDGTFAKYLHLAPGGVRVKLGQAVARGELLGLSGNTGFSSAPHLHFELGAAQDGTSSRSFPFKWRAKAAEAAGSEPVDEARYTAFEFQD